MLEAVRTPRRPSATTLVIMIALLFAPVSTRTVAEDVRDPRASADKIADTMTTAQMDQIVEVLVSESGDVFTHEDLEQITPALSLVFAKASPPGVKDLLAEKKYGNSIVVYWYRVLYRSKTKTGFQPLYAKVTYANYFNVWRLMDFSFQTDMDDINLP